MRLHVISDLHQEFGEVEVPDVVCDCVIVAGDASTKSQGLEWILQRFRKVPVIYICGNHEYYGNKLPSLTEKLKDRAAGTNVHQPQLWIHGHIHHSQYYWIGKTRILTNPRGYPDEPNPGFIPNLAITVEPRSG